MKNKVLTTLFSIGTLFAGAQSDSSYTKFDSILVKQDTIKVGNFFIVKNLPACFWVFILLLTL
jgi:hypothetical protein